LGPSKLQSALQDAADWFFNNCIFGFLQGIKFSYDKTTSILKLTGTYSMSQ